MERRIHGADFQNSIRRKYMATGDPNAPEDHEAGAIGVSRGHGAGFDRDTPPQRTKSRSMQLPSEYAEFKLADGRTLRDVMGDKFFRPAGGGKWLPKGVQKLDRAAAAPARGGKWMSSAVRKALQAGKKPARADLFSGLGSFPAAGSFGGMSRAGRLESLRARAEARAGKRSSMNFSNGGGL
jgi:hypothetical protein